jgi:hypothetical protein
MTCESPERAGRSRRGFIERGLVARAVAATLVALVAAAAAAQQVPSPWPPQEIVVRLEDPTGIGVLPGGELLVLAGSVEGTGGAALHRVDATGGVVASLSLEDVSATPGEFVGGRVETVTGTTFAYVLAPGGRVLTVDASAPGPIAVRGQTSLAPLANTTHANVFDVRTGAAASLTIGTPAFGDLTVRSVTGGLPPRTDVFVTGTSGADAADGERAFVVRMRLVGENAVPELSVIAMSSGTAARLPPPGGAPPRLAYGIAAVESVPQGPQAQPPAGWVYVALPGAPKNYVEGGPPAGEVEALAWLGAEFPENPNEPPQFMSGGADGVIFEVVSRGMGGGRDLRFAASTAIAAPACSAAGVIHFLMEAGATGLYDCFYVTPAHGDVPGASFEDVAIGEEAGFIYLADLYADAVVRIPLPPGRQ